MIKKIITAVFIVSLLILAVGCDKLPGQSTTTPPGSKIIKSVELASEWQMNQMQLEIEANEEFSVLLKLEPDDEADGFFYMEEGNDVDFSITGNSLIYKTKAPKSSVKITSDRFSFTASEDEGTTYTLLFQNNNNSKITLIMEIIFPSTGSMYVPVKTE
ncbi:MAG: hypothetical protein JXA46_04750 [Dehalococcoidales bacterium]|nr:hypothetical protein [Dehalococcoidales bacterium]